MDLGPHELDFELTLSRVTTILDRIEGRLKQQLLRPLETDRSIDKLARLMQEFKEESRRRHAYTRAKLNALTELMDRLDRERGTN